MEKLIIVGISTNARHVYEFVKAYDLYEIVGFAVNEQFLVKDTFKDLPVYPLERLDQYVDKSEVRLFVALLWNHLNRDRRKLYEELKSAGWFFANLISPTARIRGKIDGDNVWVHDFAVIQSDTTIESNVAIMSGTLIGANCHICSHCFFGAKSTVGGGTTIGNQSFVGMNCTVFDGTKIGEKCICGACSVVKRNLPDFSVCKTTSECVVKQYTKTEIEEKLVVNKNKR